MVFRCYVVASEYSTTIVFPAASSALHTRPWAPCLASADGSCESCSYSAPCWVAYAYGSYWVHGVVVAAYLDGLHAYGACVYAGLAKKVNIPVIIKVKLNKTLSRHRANAIYNTVCLF